MWRIQNVKSPPGSTYQEEAPHRESATTVLLGPARYVQKACLTSWGEKQGHGRDLRIHNLAKVHTFHVQ